MKKLTVAKPKHEDVLADFPLFDGKTMHLNTGRGDVANRVIICSDEYTAWKLARYFDNPSNSIEVSSTRHFKTYTGLFQGIPISVIASGMGGPMIDFAMRESKFCIDGPMAVIRLGQCCSISEYVVGDVVVATEGAFAVQTDFDAIHGNTKNPNKSSYKISDVVAPDSQLSKLLFENLKHSIPDEDVVKKGLNGTTDSFYGSQARFDEMFNDNNENLINEIIAKYPGAKTLEMEGYTILALAKTAKKQDVFAASASIIMNNRLDRPSKIGASQLTEIEDLTGYALFKALADFDFPDGEPLFTLQMIKNIESS